MLLGLERKQEVALSLQEGDGRLVTLLGVEVTMDVQGWRKNSGRVDFKLLGTGTGSGPRERKPPSYGYTQAMYTWRGQGRMTAEMPWGDVSTDQDPGKVWKSLTWSRRRPGRAGGGDPPAAPLESTSPCVRPPPCRGDYEKSHPGPKLINCPGEEKGEALKRLVSPSLSLTPPQCQEPPAPRPPGQGAPLPELSPGSSLLLAACGSFSLALTPCLSARQRRKEIFQEIKLLLFPVGLSSPGLKKSSEGT